MFDLILVNLAHMSWSIWMFCNVQVNNIQTKRQEKIKHRSETNKDENWFCFGFSLLMFLRKHDARPHVHHSLRVPYFFLRLSTKGFDKYFIILRVLCFKLHFYWSCLGHFWAPFFLLHPSRVTVFFFYVCRFHGRLQQQSLTHTCTLKCMITITSTQLWVIFSQFFCACIVCFTPVISNWEMHVFKSNCEWTVCESTGVFLFKRRREH